jgi:UDP-glucose 4-epimerase
MYRYRYTTGWKIVDYGRGERRGAIRKVIMSARFKKGKGYHPFIISKLPMFRSNLNSEEGQLDLQDTKQLGSFIPINQSLGTIENEILPVKIFKHFFDKASNIVILNKCPCRVNRDCQDHKQDIGCMHLGDDTLKMMITEEKGRVITKEEAFEILKDAVEDGLIPLLGRARGESTGFNVEDTGRFMSMCYCCTCCCVNAKYMTHGSVGNVDKTIFRRMEGVTVKVDEDLCVGCGECLEVCKFRGMKMIDGIANVNQERCLGCGRCENTCPNDAISIKIDEDSRVDELISKLESYVDVAPQ